MTKKLFLICTLLSIFFVNAQTSVSGVVQDNDGIALPGATIINEDSGATAVSDFDGNFSIQAEEGQILSVSFIGYAIKNIEAALGGMIIQMDPDNVLDEIVVTSLGITRAKKSLGYAVQTVGGEEARALTCMEYDLATDQLVQSWPALLDDQRARDLGFPADADLESMIRSYVEMINR